MTHATPLLMAHGPAGTLITGKQLNDVVIEENARESHCCYEMMKYQTTSTQK